MYIKSFVTLVSRSLLTPRSFWFTCLRRWCWSSYFSISVLHTHLVSAPSKLIFMPLPFSYHLIFEPLSCSDHLIFMLLLPWSNHLISMLLLSCPDHLIIILLPLWDHFRSRSYHLRTIWSSCCYRFRTLWSSCSSSDYSILMLLLPSSDHFFIVLLCPSSDRFSFILLLFLNRLMYMLLLPSSNHLKFTLLHHLWFNFHFHTIWPSCYFLSYTVWFPHYFHFNTIGSPYSHRIFEPLDFHTVTPSHNLFFQHPQFVFLRHRFIWPHYENPPKETPFSLRVSRISIKIVTDSRQVLLPARTTAHTPVLRLHLAECSFTPCSINPLEMQK